MDRPVDVRPLRLAFAAPLLFALACEDACLTTPEPPPSDAHSEYAQGIYAKLGDPVPYASDTQLETFERGERVATRRFSLADGLGPAFNVTFCASCHEKPVFGGSAGLYRNFFLTGMRTEEGAFFPSESAGPAGGVVRMYFYGDPEDEPARPAVPTTANVVAQRNPIPFFGVGLLAELSEDEILKRADPDDADRDGISGRPNYDRGFVGRFGRKAQTVSIEGFIRGPLFNHLGVTTDPLTDEQRALLPIDSSGGEESAAFAPIGKVLLRFAQAAAPDGPLTDDDGAPDPELSTDDLFDLVSWAMLLAPAQPGPLDEHVEGQKVFDACGCQKCHTPRLTGPRGPLPLYSDLLLHDMGPDLDDGLPQKEATTSEFRTQPLWGISAVGPYLHDGRAMTIDEAIVAHGGEATSAQQRYVALAQEQKDQLYDFLVHRLGGLDQFTAGLLPPDADDVDGPDVYGGMWGDQSEADKGRFAAGRRDFDREFGLSDGAGGPRMNGDSCRACHFEPVIGGAGPRGVNVMRHGILNDSDEFVVPGVGTILHKSTALPDSANRPQPEANIFEHRQTPALFGLGLLEALPDEVILAGADPDDADGDGISGKPSWTDGGKLGRFGWKAQVPSIEEFVRDAVTAELGMTLPAQDGLSFGKIHDNDDVPDPELGLDFAESLAFYIQRLAPPPRGTPDDPDAAARGEGLFDTVGCTSCHVPALTGPDGDVPAYSDLLLHEILPADAVGIEDASATMREMRTAPLWGISTTAPYLHSGAADTLDEAIRAHDGEAATVRDAYEALSDAEREDLLSFLNTL
jgi:CxxC motif-containing protein (DUF1111 family)